MKKLTNWFIGESLHSTPDYFEKAKIRLTFNLSLMIFVVLALTLPPLIAAGLVIDFVLTLVVLVLLLSVCFVLKLKRDVLLASVLFTVVSFSIISASTLLETDNIAFSNMPFSLAVIIYSFFTLGKKWGGFLCAFNIILWIYYTAFMMKANLHNEMAFTQEKIGLMAFVTLIGFFMVYYVAAQFLKGRAYAENKIRQNNKDLEAMVKELESFSYSVSHDLRAPLRSIKSYSSLLETKYGQTLDSDGKTSLKFIARSAAKLDRLIEDLLAFSRSGRQDLNKISVHMDTIVKEVVEELQHENPGRVFEMRINLPPIAQADPNLIRQVWINLVSNAIKYSSKTEHPVIEVGSTEEADSTIYYIKDNGAGFDMQYAGKLFNVFQRLHTDSEFAGTGIGLAIVKRIVERHGGKVWAEGKPNEGATFYFSLPFVNITS